MNIQENKEKTDDKFFSGNPTLLPLNDCFNANRVIIDGVAYCTRVPRGDLIPCDTMLPVQQYFGCDKDTNRLIELSNKNDRNSYISKYNIDMRDKTKWTDTFNPENIFEESVKNDLLVINNMGGYAYNKTISNPYTKEGFNKLGTNDYSFMLTNINVAKESTI